MKIKRVKRKRVSAKLLFYAESLLKSLHLLFLVELKLPNPIASWQIKTFTSRRETYIYREFSLDPPPIAFDNFEGKSVMEEY